MAGAKAQGIRAILNRGLLIEIPRRIGISQQAQAIPNAISKYAITPFLFFMVPFFGLEGCPIHFCLSKLFSSMTAGTYSIKSFGHSSLAVRKRARASGRSPRRARYSPA